MKRWIVRSSISAMVLAALIVVASVAFRHDILRYHYVRKLCGDEESRARAIAYLVRKADDHRVTEHAGRHLDGAERGCFDAAVRGLARAGQWGPKYGPAWVRYLTERAEEVEPPQRSAIAVELGQMLWHRRPHHDDPRIASAIEKLLRDESAVVRMNALSAAACLPGPGRSSLIRVGADDAEQAVRRRAAGLLALLSPTGEPDPPPPPPSGAPEGVRRLAELEGLPTASADLEITHDMPDLIRLHAVRVSTASLPEQLTPLFAADQPTLRDLACTVALGRFTAGQCRELAADLLRSFGDNQRRGGAVLAGMAQGSAGDAELLKLLRLRLRSADPWITKQHYNLALGMIGERVEGFDPATLMLRSDMPRTTLIMAMLHTGRLDGADWLLSPFGEPPLGGVEGLRLLLDFYRYDRVLRRYLPDISAFDFWAEPGEQRDRVNLIRDWYLIHRPGLVFDPQRRVFDPRRVFALGGTLAE